MGWRDSRVAESRLRAQRASRDHRRDPPPRRGPGARAGGDCEPHALHERQDGAARAPPRPLHRPGQRPRPRRLAGHRPPARAGHVQLPAFGAARAHGGTHPWLPRAALLPKDGHDEQAHVQRHPRALSQAPRPRLRRQQAPDPPHRARPHQLLRRRGRAQTVPAGSRGGGGGGGGGHLQRPRPEAHAGVRGGTAPRRPLRPRPKHRRGALCQRPNPGAGVHVDSGVGRELPCPPRGDQGHRVLRRREGPIRRLPRHRRPPDDGARGSTAVRRQGRELRLCARAQEELLQEVPLRAFPRGVAPSGCAAQPPHGRSVRRNRQVQAGRRRVPHLDLLLQEAPGEPKLLPSRRCVHPRRPGVPFSLGG
mmetsp:Transcript_11443/g.26920  ORF Transcript_11443/g.26920 Transcript_11443/m.26920 type:complete len:364 (+) Transcript_11443:2817-3908(+)